MKKIENFKVFEKFNFYMGFNKFYFHELLIYNSKIYNQKVSPWFEESIGVHHLGVRAVARALRVSKDGRENAICLQFSP